MKIVYNPLSENFDFVRSDAELDARYLRRDGSTPITANWNVDGAGTLFVDKTNKRVGIGTTSPGTNLTVKEQASQTTPPLNILDRASNEIFSVRTDNTIYEGNAWGAQFVMKSFSSTKLTTIMAQNNQNHYVQFGITDSAYIYGVGANKAFFRAHDGASGSPLYVTDGGMNLTKLYTGSMAIGGTTAAYGTPPSGGLIVSGNVGIGETAPDYKLDVNGTIGFTPGSSVTPVDNGDVVVEATNNTTLTFKLKGSDGTIRSGTLTLS